MSRPVRSLALGFVVASLVPGVVAAQSLAEVARQEQERRKQVKEPSKVYTNQDLRSYPTPPPTVAAAAPTPAQPPAGAAAPAPESKPAAPPQASATTAPPTEPSRDEAYWRGRITATREALERSQMFRDALQSRINALTTDFVNRDDPAQRAAIAFDRQKALAELDRVENEIQRQTAQIGEIEEEARRAGVPPGWLR